MKTALMHFLQFCGGSTCAFKSWICKEASEGKQGAGNQNHKSCSPTKEAPRPWPRLHALWHENQARTLYGFEAPIHRRVELYDFGCSLLLLTMFYLWVAFCGFCIPYSTLSFGARLAGGGWSWRLLRLVTFCDLVSGLPPFTLFIMHTAWLAYSLGL